MKKKQRDEDSQKGAVEQDSPKQKSNSSLRGQLGHRSNDPMVKESDSDFPEPGGNPEHTGEQDDERESKGR